VAIITKLRLPGMQLPAKYKETFDVSSELSEGLSSGRPYQLPDEGSSLETSNFTMNFSVNCIPAN
jgi:hypothetical protein